MSKAMARLSALGLELPALNPAVASYEPFVVVDRWIHVSGQLPMKDGNLMAKGWVGQEVSVEDAQQAARQCALQALALLAAAAGDLDKVRIVRVGGFVASAPGFEQQPQVIDGASQLFLDILGEDGRHARAAVGVAALPLGAAVEVEVLARLK